MTYKLDSCVGKIKSPVIAVFPDGGEMRFRTGADVAEAGFGKRYAIAEMAARENEMLLKLKALEGPIANQDDRDATFF